MIGEANDGWCMGVKGVGGWAAAEPRSAVETRLLLVRVVDVQAAPSTCLKQEWTHPAVM